VLKFNRKFWRLKVNVAPKEEVHWCEVRWPGRPNHWPAPFNSAIVVSGVEMLILKRISFPLSLRQQQQSGSNVALLSAHVTLCCVVVGCLSRSVAVRLNSVLNWYEIEFFFFRIIKWFCLISSLNQTQFDGPWRCKDSSPTHSSLTLNLYFGPPCHLTKFGHVLFPHPV
jgi:hypothetical protein